MEREVSGCLEKLEIERYSNWTSQSEEDTQNRSNKQSSPREVYSRCAGRIKVQCGDPLGIAFALYALDIAIFAAASIIIPSPTLVVLVSACVRFEIDTGVYEGLRTRLTC
jgi:hypothetical protein